MKMNRSLALTLALLFMMAMASATGCNKNKQPSTPAGGGSTAPATAAPASVRIVHAAEAGAVDVLVDGSVAVSGLARHSFTRDRLSVPAGSRSISVNGAGSSSSVLSFSADFASGRDYTVVVVGGGNAPLASVQAADSLTSDNLGKFRVIHGVPGADGVRLTVENGAELASGVNYRQASGYLSVPSGTQRISLYAGGAQPVLSDAVPFNAQRIITTVVVRDGAGLKYINIPERAR